MSFQKFSWFVRFSFLKRFITLHFFATHRRNNAFDNFSANSWYTCNRVLGFFPWIVFIGFFSILRSHNVMKFGMVNKQSFLNNFVIHTLNHNIRHSVLIPRKTFEKIENSKYGEKWKRAIFFAGWLELVVNSKSVFRQRLDKLGAYLHFHSRFMYTCDQLSVLLRTFFFF